MTESADPTGRSARADAELADAMDSIEAIGEDWRSRERGTDDASAPSPEGIVPAAGPVSTPNPPSEPVLREDDDNG